MIYRQRLRFLLKKKFFVKNIYIYIYVKKRGAEDPWQVHKKKKREVKKRDSPQAQDHQEKWGEQLMNLPCAWTERKKIEEVGELAAR